MHHHYLKTIIIEDWESLEAAGAGNGKTLLQAKHEQSRKIISQ